jgi:hypothetical protein
VAQEKVTGSILVDYPPREPAGFRKNAKVEERGGAAERFGRSSSSSPEGCRFKSYVVSQRSLAGGEA